MALPPLDPWAIAVLFAAIALGSVAKGVTGIGLPIFAIPLIAVFMGVEHGVVVMALPALVSNLWLVWANRRQAPRDPRFAAFLFAGTAGGVLGTWFLAFASPESLSLTLAVWLAVYLVLLLRRTEIRLPANRLASPLAGLASGVVQGATGISAPLIAPYLQALGLARDAFVFAIALAFSLFGIAQIAAILQNGLLTPDRLAHSLLALLPVALFLPLGMRLGHLGGERMFRLFFIGILILLELRLLQQGFGLSVPISP